MGENPEYKLIVSVFVCVVMCSQQLSGIICCNDQWHFFRIT